MQADAKTPRRPYEHKLMHLALLALHLQKIIVERRRPAGLTLARVLRRTVPAS